MGDLFEGIDPKLRKWIGAQSIFFVGTAPLSKKGRVNVSPKGPIGSLRVLDETTLAYLDVVGSGAETIAHLRENGRIVVMLCAFEGPPRIVRLHGRGEVVLPSSKRFAALLARARFRDGYIHEARRAIVLVHVDRVADSCGFGVPFMRFEGTRPQMNAWSKKKLEKYGSDALLDYQRQKNAKSIDGLPAINAVATLSYSAGRRPRRSETSRRAGTSADCPASGRRSRRRSA